jgi:dimethylargininase
MSNDVVHGALVREVSRSLGDCELLHLPRARFDLDLAREQHRGYVAALQSAGIAATLLPEVPNLPDSCFVEDALVILDDVAVICRPGAVSRRPETDLMEKVISGMRPIRRIVSPGTLEGGDVLRVGKRLYVGLSTRTNVEGLEQFKQCVEPFGYQVIPIKVFGCLHLKTGVTVVEERLALMNPTWVDRAPFADWRIIEVAPEEPWGANTLTVNGGVFVTASAPETAGRLEREGLRVIRLDISELQKAEAGLTCLSVLFRDIRRPGQ